MRAPTTWSARGTALALAAVLLLIGAACGPATGIGTATLGASPCVPPPPTQPVTPPASGHLSYSRTACGPLPVKRVWRPGETVQYQWLASPRNPMPDGGDAPVLLTFAVFGSFPSQAAAQAEQARLGTARMPPGRDPMANPPNTPVLPPPPPVVRAPSLTTDTWNAQPLTATLQLPPTLAPGYYVLCLIAVTGESATPNTQTPTFETSQSSAIIQIIAP